MVPDIFEIITNLSIKIQLAFGDGVMVCQTCFGELESNVHDYIQVAMQQQ